MSKKESTSEKIVRMYKEGKSFDEIAKELGMPKDNVPKILEKHMPDYENYTPVASAEKNDKKKKKGFGGFFAKKDKAVETQSSEGTAAVEPKNEEPKNDSKSRKKTQAVPTINLAMNEEGFVDSVAQGIAHMLRQGKSVESILAFFAGRSEEDVNAVRECMDEHFKRIEAVENAINAEKSKPTVSSSAYSLTGLEENAVINKPKFTAPEKPDDELSDEMPSIDPVSLDELDKQIEAMANGKSTDSDNDEPVPEMESVSLFSKEDDNDSSQPAESNLESETEENTESPVSIFDEPAEEENEASSVFDFETQSETEENSEESGIFEDKPKDEPLDVVSMLTEQLEKTENKADEEDSVSADAVVKTDDTDQEEQISFTLDEEDDSMSPMEKMKKFAQQQISLNEKKIEELKSKKEEILGSADSIDSEIAENETALEDIQNKIQENANETASVKTRLEELEREIEEQKSKLDELESKSGEIAKEADQLNAKNDELKAKKESIQSDAAAVDDEIAEVEKENKEFAEYC